jgi:hypothetical protein
MERVKTGIVVRVRARGRNGFARGLGVIKIVFENQHLKSVF